MLRADVPQALRVRDARTAIAFAAATALRHGLASLPVVAHGWLAFRLEGTAAAGAVT